MNHWIMLRFRHFNEEPSIMKFWKWIRTEGPNKIAMGFQVTP